MTRLIFKPDHMAKNSDMPYTYEFRAWLAFFIKKQTSIRASAQVDATQGEGIRGHNALDLHRQSREVVCHRTDQPPAQRA